MKKCVRGFVECWVECVFLAHLPFLFFAFVFLEFYLITGAYDDDDDVSLARYGVRCETQTPRSAGSSSSKRSGGKVH